MIRWENLKVNTPKRVYVFLISYAVLSTIYSLLFKKPANHNNYIIFKTSFFHLLDGVSLYQLYPEKYADYYKYSPTFALFFGVFAYLPKMIGASLWNGLGTAMLCWGLHRLPLQPHQKVATFWVFLPAYIGSVMNFQSNIHLIALLLLYWQSLEDRKAFSAALFLSLGFFVKVFSIFALIMMLFYMKSWRWVFRFTFYFLMSMALLFLAPLLFVSFESLMFQYSEWRAHLQMDTGVTHGYSVMSILAITTGLAVNNTHVQVGAALLWIVIFFYKRNTNWIGRLYAFCSLSFFFLMFNHRSESSTFVIAMVGLGLYQNFIENQKVRWAFIAIGLLGVNFFHSSLFTTKFKHFLNEYSFKIWPFLILGPAVLYSLWKSPRETFPAAKKSSK